MITVNFFIDALADVKHKLEGAVASSGAMALPSIH